MAYRSGFAIALGTAASMAACEPNSDVPCSEIRGEFPPTHCAYVTGRVTAADAPMAGAGLRVGLFVPSYGYQYVSDPVATDAHGRFRLVVFRMVAFEPPTVPDTVTLYIKVYSGVSIEQHPLPIDSLPVLMTFAPLGTMVDTTRADLTLP